MTTTSSTKIAQGAAVVALLFLLPALLDLRLSYSYFLNLRWVVLLACIVIAVARRSNIPMLFLTVVTALIFNPLLPFHFNRSGWRVIDLLAMVQLGWVIVEH